MKTIAKTLIAVAAIAALSGCAVYPAPGYGAYDNYGGSNAGPAYVGQPQPAYIYGGVYRDGGYRNTYPRGYNGNRPAPAARDRDHDGIPDRVDRDRDGDGVPNYRDAWPGNPYVR